MGICVYESVSTHQNPERAITPLELELHDFVSHLTRVLGTKLGSSIRAVCTLDHRAVSPELPPCLCVFETGYLSGTQQLDKTWLVSESQRSSHFYLPRARIPSMGCHDWLPYMDSVDLMLVHQVFYQLIHSPALKLFKLYLCLHIIFQDIKYISNVCWI